MLPLPSNEWYKAYPKPINSQYNFNVSIFCQGLHLLKKDYKLFVNKLNTTIKQSNILFKDSNFNLQSYSNKRKVLIVLKSLISKNGAQYSQNEIDDKIVIDYLFKLTKQCQYNKKRSSVKTVGSIPALKLYKISFSFTLMQTST